jgi:phage terminase small subunit
MTKNDNAHDNDATSLVVERALTPQQLRFVQEYIVDLNATAAYLRAGYNATSLDSAQASSSRLLSDAMVQIAIAKRQAQVDRSLGISAERIERQSARIAFSDIRDIVDIAADGTATVKPTSEWTDAAAAAVASVTITEYKGQTKVTVKLHDKIAGLEQLYKRQNLYARHEAAGGEALADVFAAGLKAGARLQATATTIAQPEPEQLPSSIEGDFRESEAEATGEE